MPGGNFGRIAKVEALQDGGVAVLDNEPEGAPVLVFDSTGRRISAFGAFGEGPGQFIQGAGLESDASGRVLIMDGRHQRLSAWSPSGNLVGEMSTRRITQSDRLGGVKASNEPAVYLAEVVPNRGLGPSASLWTTASRRWHRLNLSDSSVSLHPSESQLPPGTPRLPFAREYYRTVVADGRIVTASSDRLGISWHGDAGGVQGFWMTADPPQVLPAERAELERVRDAINRRFDELFRPPAYEIAERKQVLTDVITDRAGFVWFARTTTGVEGPPIRAASAPDGQAAMTVRYRNRPLFSVFRIDGTYLGDVLLSGNIEMVSVEGSTLWAVVSNVDGVQSLERYRIPVGPGVRVRPR